MSVICQRADVELCENKSCPHSKPHRRQPTCWVEYCPAADKEVGCIEKMICCGAEICIGQNITCHHQKTHDKRTTCHLHVCKLIDTAVKCVESNEK